jgi:hypothetical protein
VVASDQLDADAAGALQHLLDLHGQVELAVACDGQAGRVGFARGQVLDPGRHGLFVFRGNALFGRQSLPNRSSQSLNCH